MSGRQRLDALYPPGQIVVREVGLRDGLQLTHHFPSTAAKAEWISADYEAGIRNFEVGSYLPVEKYPQFEDVDDVVEIVAGMEGAYSSVLVLNRKGAHRALAGRADELISVISASEEHNQRNTRRSREQSLEELAELADLAKSGERRPVLAVAFSMAFGCSIAGKDAVSQTDTLRLIEASLKTGAEVVSIADTVGYASPNKVRSMLREARRVVGSAKLGIHVHDTRGLGIANVAVALEEGVDFVDASLGGLGGCPFAPGATGNVVLEDVLFLVGAMGLGPTVNLPALERARQAVQAAMPEEELYGHIARAGLPRMPTASEAIGG